MVESLESINILK